MITNVLATKLCQQKQFEILWHNGGLCMLAHILSTERQADRHTHIHTPNNYSGACTPRVKYIVQNALSTFILPLLFIYVLLLV